MDTSDSNALDMVNVNLQLNNDQIMDTSYTLLLNINQQMDTSSNINQVMHTANTLLLNTNQPMADKIREFRNIHNRKFEKTFAHSYIYYYC